MNLPSGRQRPNRGDHDPAIGPAYRQRASALLAFLLLTCLNWACGGPLAISPTPSSPHTYTTQFPLTENPISEGGNWVNGGAVGLNWTNVRTIGGLAIGTESGSGGYDDSTAVLAGDWNTNQTAQATVHTVNQDSDVYEEVELRLRTTIAPHSITGYEINFRCTHDGSQYVQIVRWNGPFGSFTVVSDTSSTPGLHNGDTVKATIQGSTISVYLNGALVLEGTDSTYTTGSPGIGFFLSGGTGVNADYGFTSFTASD